MPNHPILPCGFNADPIDGDEVDGAGTNWDVWPALFDSFIGLTPMVVTVDMTAAFGECPDVIIACVDDTYTIRPGPRMQTIRGEPQELEIAGENDTAVLSREPNTTVIRRRA